MKVLRRRRRCILALVWICVQWPVFTEAAEPQRLTSAVIIYGTGGIATWGQNFNNHYRNALGPELSQYFTPEFLKLSGASESDKQLMADSLALKYSDSNIDLIIPVLPEANSFVHDYGSIFAPNAATIHVLPDDDTFADHDTLRNEAVISSASGIAVARTASVMKQLFPNLQQLYVVGGIGEGDQVYMNRYRNTLESTGMALQINYLSGLPPEDLLRTLSEAPPDSAVLMSTYDKDTLGRSYRTVVVTQLLSEGLSIPVFANTNVLVSGGALGGAITTAEDYARSAYEKTIDYLNGDFANEIVTADTGYMFNGAMLDRFNVNRSLLPDDALIVMDNFSIWRTYGRWMLVLGVVILAQLVLIALLLEARRRSRLAESELRRTHKLEALGTLAGGIAHDFNNILMSIMANTELAVMAGDNNPKVKERLDRIQSASERARNLVAQILMFSRNTPQQQLETLELGALVQESIEQIQDMLPDTCRIKYRRTIPEALVKGDSTQVHQLVTNMCVNAQHAMDNNGVIEISIGKVHLDAKKMAIASEIPAGEYTTLRIADKGVGISEEDLIHVFEPFYTTKSEGKGTGLGLALVFQIMKAHNGFIDMRSKLGEGTEAIFYFPMATQQQSMERSPLTAEIKRGHNERILLVDDDEMVLDATQKTLESLHYKVTAFANSAQALQYFEKHQDEFDLVFTDLSMPLMDGVRLISNIRRIRADLPAILYTGYLDNLPARDIEGLKLLKKPVSLVDVSNAVREVLTRKIEK